MLRFFARRPAYIFGISALAALASIPVPAHAAVSFEGRSHSAVWSDPWIPDFCADEPGEIVAASEQPGRWSNPDTWGGVIPAPSSRVRVQHDVILDQSVTADSICVEGDGALRFDTDNPTRVLVETVTVGPDAMLEIGTRERPIAVYAELVFADTTFRADADPGQYGHGLIVNGTLTVAGRPIERSFVRLAREPKAGDRELLLEKQVPGGWQRGDRVLLPDTRQQLADGSIRFTSHAEELRLADVQGRLLVLAEPLKHDHRGAYAIDGRVPILPHVVSLDRNVVIRSERPDGVRGHVMLMHRARVDIAWAVLRDLGRTSLDVPDTVEFDAAGEFVRAPTNQIGRYALHLHHLLGPSERPEHGWQFRLVGNVVENALKWSIVLHDSHFGLVQDNVAYGFGGSGFVTEQGNESHNLFERNFAVGITAGADVELEIFPDGKNAEPMGGVLVVQEDLLGIGKRQVAAFGAEGSGFWARLPHNRFVGNVAANMRYAGFNLNGYGMAQIARVPTRPGQSHTEMLRTGPLRLLEFRDNEVYASPFGLWTAYYAGVKPGGVGAYASNGHARIDDFTAWHTSHAGVSSYHNNFLHLEDLVVRGDVEVAPRNTQRASRGIAMDTYRFYQNGQISIRDADIQGHNIGIALPAFPDDRDPSRPNQTLIEGGYLANYVSIMEPGSSLPVDGDKTTIIRGVSFGRMEAGAAPGLPPVAATVWMNFEPDFYHKRHGYAARPSRTFLYPSAGPGYRLYFEEQNPWTRMPQDACVPSLSTRAGDAVEVIKKQWPGFRGIVTSIRDLFYTINRQTLGLQRPASWSEEVSNAECWDTQQRAIAGDIAPCGDASCNNGRALSGIVGLAFPLRPNEEYASTDGDRTPLLRRGD